MKRLLTICPSRIRPDRLSQMMRSWDETQSGNCDIVVYVDENDPKVNEYKNIKLKSNQNILYGERKHLVSVLNYCCSIYPDYEYYNEINDDHIYRTNDWDEKLINLIKTKGNGWGISFGKSLIFPDNNPDPLPSGIVISGNIIKALGYIVTPLLQHTYTDDYYRALGKGIDKYFKDNDVIIEHCHVIRGKAEMDDNYKWVMSTEQMDYGLNKYKEWYNLYRENDIEKVKKAYENRLSN